MRGRLTRTPQHVAHVMTVTYGKEHTHIDFVLCKELTRGKVRYTLSITYMKAAGAHSEEFHVMSA